MGLYILPRIAETPPSHVAYRMRELLRRVDGPSCHESTPVLQGFNGRLVAQSASSTSPSGSPID
eukprot:scaffold263614_cov31-Prasinocladus_malaysianus.AAC.1